MKPIANWDLITEAGDVKPLPAGIYPVRITSVKDVAESEYFEVTCDIVGGEYNGYFKTLVDSGLKDSSKTVRSYKTNALPFFKAFITAVEKTNPGYKWDWDEQKLVGKNVIAIFGEEEYIDKDGNIRVITKVQEFRSKEAYQTGKLTVPALKKLSEEEVKKAKEQQETVNKVPDAPTPVNLDDLPF